MKTLSRKLRFAALALAPFLAPAALAGDGSAPLSVKVDGLSPWVAAAVQDKARQGITELRRYVERTRMIHSLYLPDLVRADDDREQAAAPTEVPPLATVPAQRNSLASAARQKVTVANARQKAPVTVAKSATPMTAKPKALARAGNPTRSA